MSRRLIFLILCVFSAPAFSQSEPLLPLEPGNSWTYQIDEDPADTVTETALAEFEINDNGLIRIDSVPIENDSVSLPTTVFYYVPAFSNTYFIARETINGDVFTYITPLPLGGGTGDVTYQPGGMGSVFGGLTYSSTSVVMATDESVIVPADT